MKRFTRSPSLSPSRCAAPAFAQQPRRRRGAPGLRRPAGHAVLSAGPRTTSRTRRLAAQPGTASGDLRELRLEEAVTLALEKNLDIQVAKLEPQSVDFQVAGFQNQFQPVLASTRRPARSVPAADAHASTAAPASTTAPPPTTRRSSQEVPKFGGNYTVAGPTSASASSDALATRQPASTTGLVASLRAADPARLQDRQPPPAAGDQPDQPRHLRRERARHGRSQTLANVRNAYWDLVFSQSAVDVAQRATELADKLVEDNQARVEVGTLAPLDIVQAQAEAATRRQNLAAAEATAQTAELALKRYIVSGTDDPLWRQTIRPVDLPIARAAADRCRRRGSPRALRAHRHASTLARTSTRTTSTSSIFKDLSMPALDLNASYGAQGLGGPGSSRTGTGLDCQVTGTIIPAAIPTRSALLRNLDYPNWNFAVTLSYPLVGSQATAQHARARLQRNQSHDAHPRAGSADRRRSRQRGADRAEQPEARRSRDRGARAGAEAPRSRTEQVRGRHDDQLLRRAGAARSARRGRTPSCARWPTIASRSSTSSGRSRRRRAAVAAATSRPHRRSSDSGSIDS